jgi:hypothetical protein
MADTDSTVQTRPLRVLLISSWQTPCGIAEHSALLKAAVEQADPDLEIQVSAELLDPTWYGPSAGWLGRVGLVHLNHHDALHAKWTAEHVRELEAVGIPVVVTYHDSRETIEDCPKLAALAEVASAVVVHEPVEGLARGIYMRQGVPAPATRPMEYYARNLDIQGHHPQCFKAYPQQPVLGTVGFTFPWKNFDRLAEETGKAGWALVVVSAQATEADELRWHASNPHLRVVRGWIPTPEIINYLAGCTATAFMYETANTGTSGAIRQGIAARRPVIAMSGCRQFRDLREDDHGRHFIRWAADWEGFRTLLKVRGFTAFDAPTHALAERDSWVKQGEKYATLYRALLTRTGTP